MGSFYDESDDGYDVESEEADYSMYQKLPEEYADRRRSELEIISEDCESDNNIDDNDDETEEEKDYFPSPTSSVNTNYSYQEPPATPNYFTFRRTSLERQYPRSNSAVEVSSRSNSLAPTKSKLKRTESTNRAEYLLKVKFLKNNSHYFSSLNLKKENLSKE